MHIFAQIVAGQHGFDIQQLGLDRVVRDMTEQDHLRMLGLTGEATSNGYGFGHSGISVQVVFAGLADFASSDEVWPVEFFEHD